MESSQAKQSPAVCHGDCLGAAQASRNRTTLEKLAQLARSNSAHYCLTFSLSLFLYRRPPSDSHPSPLVTRHTQSTNINSFESSNTWAYFSQGLSGVGGGVGGPPKSRLASHSVM